MKSYHAGMGVVICEDVLTIDKSFLSRYTDFLKSTDINHFRLIEKNGKTIAVNKTGFEFNADDIKLAPRRFTNLSNIQYPQYLAEETHIFLQSIEDAIYSALVEYCSYFYDASTTAWWRPYGHIAMYSEGQRIGPHCDDQVPFEWGEKTGNQVSMHNSTSINLYLNSGTNAEGEFDDLLFSGGELNFPQIPFSWAPKAGSVALYPSNYVGTHEVTPVTKGERYAYLSVACYGTSFDHLEVVGDTNSPKIWMPHLGENARMLIQSKSNNHS